MAFQQAQVIRAAPGSSDPTIIPLAIVDASQTINLGDFLKYSSGKLVQAITAPAAGNYTITNGITLAGVAASAITTDATGYQSGGGVAPQNTIDLAMADDHLNILLPFLGATATGSATIASLGTASEVQDALPAATYSLGRYTNSAGASWYFLSKSTTTPELNLIELTQDYMIAPNGPASATTQYPTWWVKIVPAYRANG